jgi:hypothetical protein
MRAAAVAVAGVLEGISELRIGLLMLGAPFLAYFARSGVSIRTINSESPDG